MATKAQVIAIRDAVDTYVDALCDKIVALPATEREKAECIGLVEKAALFAKYADELTTWQLRVKP